MIMFQVRVNVGVSKHGGYLDTPANFVTQMRSIGQAKDGTWKEYQSKTGQRGAERDDFGDVADFIGWYADVIRKSTGIAVSDTYRLYLAYHEGPTGYRRGSYKDKAWLQGVAHKVSLRAERYARQYADCGG